MLLMFFTGGTRLGAGRRRINLTRYRRRPTRDQGPLPETLCDGCGERPRLRAGPAPTPTSDSPTPSNLRPEAATGTRRSPGSGWIAAGGRLLVSTTHLARLQHTDPGPDLTEGPGQRMPHDSHGPGLLPERRLQTPPPERERRKGRADGSLPCSGSVPLRSRREAGSRKKSLSRFPTKLKQPVRKTAY